MLTAQELSDSGLEPSETDAKQQITAAIKVAAKRLGNRPATCRKYYVHPKVPEAYLAGNLVSTMRAARQKTKHLEPYESAVLEILDP